MSERCHICGPVKHEAPTVICAPCALTLEGREHEAALLAELIELRILRSELKRFRDGRWLAPMEGESSYATSVRRHIDDILALAPSSGCAGVRRPRVSGVSDGPRKAESAPPAGELRRCNLHDDCAAADAAVRNPPAFHCYDSECVVCR